MSAKKYGLIIPGSAKSQQPNFQASRNVFGEDSDSDNDSKKKPVLLRPSHNIIRQAKISREKAVKEDPTVYQYDEVYDSMKMQKEITVNKNKQNKQPRYIENLMKTANKRKIENERRIERQIQKEREKEGDEFADKEVFVTTAYKKKLEEMKLEEEKEKREEYLESIGDVTKQKDLGGFYRHLYEQKLGSQKEVEDNTNSTLSGDLGKEVKEVNNESLTPEPKSQFKKKDDQKLKYPDRDASKRNYRKRKSSTNVQMSEGEIEDSDDEINRINISEIREAKRSKKVEENIDADSDFSIDESSDEEDNQSQPKKPAIETKIPEVTDLKPKEKVVSTKQNEALKIKEPKTKVDIWKKRTVGEIFEQALKRYYERKALRG